MSRLAQAEIEREARRVLRRLASARTALFARADDFAVARSAAAAAGSRLALASPFVQAFLRAGWIMADGPHRFLLADEGRAFLVRSFGGEDRFAEQHREMESRQIDGRAVKVNVGESPLARLHSRGLADGTQFAAGEKLRRDYTLAQLTPRLGVDLTQPAVTGGRSQSADSISDIAVAARQRFSRAMAAAGPGLADLAFEVCCDLQALEGAETRRGWSKRAGRVVLLLALDRLAAHYGMILAVADNGTGIAAADLERLGRPFEQAATAHGKEGTGLGLALVKSLAALHGGEAQIASVLGEGTCVTLRLPHAAVEIAAPQSAVVPFRGAA